MNIKSDLRTLSIKHNSELDKRQRRERDYHEEFGRRNHRKIAQPVLFDVIEPGPRRPWNGYWTAYDFLMAESLAGKRVLVPGCGFGEDAIRLAKLHAEVYAFDLSPELLEIARERATRLDITDIDFHVMPAETLYYSNSFFDLVFFNDILHHVNIPKTVAEVQRVLKPGGRIIANELYTHSMLQKVRASQIVEDFLYPRMARFIYGTINPYITQDERKLNQHELKILTGIMKPDSLHQKYFHFLAGRILPARPRVEKIDRALMAMAGAVGPVLAGRVVLAGTVVK